MSENNELTFDQVNALLAYDPDTGLLTWKVSRGRHGNACKAGSVAGCLKTDGYLLVRVHGKLYPAHRLAWLLHTGSWPSKHLDHINGNPADNRIENLRKCTQAENCQNRAKQSNNKSGVAGVSRHKQTGKWRAYIYLDGKRIHLGYFGTLEEAAAARAEAKAMYHTFNPNDR